MDQETAFDIAIIGGGINGCGIARDAARRGAKVLLLERGDLAQGTSSASTKLIHGGLRYLEHYEFALVREALQEREILWAIAPHIIWPLRFILPHRKGLRPRWLLRLGLFLYDHIGGRKRLPGTATINLAAAAEGKALKPGFGTAFVYSDGWVDDARLVVLNARDAADHGATVRTRCDVTRLERDGDQWQITAGGVTFRARTIINAAGPQVMRLLERSPVESAHRLRLVRGSHIVVPKLYDGPHCWFFQLADGRIFFAIPYEHDFTLVGTTDVDAGTAGADAAPAITEAEIRYLCDGVNQYFARSITPADMVHSYSGIRPLVDDGSGKPEAATRGYRFEVDRGADGSAAPLLSVHGGKITTFRRLAMAALAHLADDIPALAAGCSTGTAPLPGGDFAAEGLAEASNLAGLEARIASAAPQRDAATIHRLARLYGTAALTFAAPDMGHDFGHGFTEAEARHLVAREWAQTADDILWRRSKLGLRFTADQRAVLEDWLKDNA